MTSSEAKLLSFLGSSELPPAARATLKRSIQEFVLQYGWWYHPIELPKQIAPGTPQQCHTNAIDLTLADDTLIYCEGYALFRNSSQPRIHAWVTDGKGNAIDNTWPQPGVVYAGVPFTSNFVSMMTLKNHAAVSLLDDFQNGFPLLGTLGDRPDEWLNLRGRGTTKLI